MPDVVGHLLLFALTGSLMLLIPLLIGKLIRPSVRSPEKDAIYECGEPTIGSSFIQFDLRFYTVALLFIVFDVEVAFFFPWATVYGTAGQLADQRVPPAVATQLTEQLASLPAGTLKPDQAIDPQTALALLKTGLVDILVFFGVLLVGFAYVWKRGDLDWVRSLARQTEHRQHLARTPTVIPPPEATRQESTVA